MRVFKISETSRKLHSDLPLEFEGIFVLDEENHQIRGYMEQMYRHHSNTIYYVYGKYNEKENQLAYLKLTNRGNISPFIYVFHNTTKNGVWSHYSQMNCTFFDFGMADGDATVTLTEVTKKSEIRNLANDAIGIFNQALNSTSNLMLIFNGVEPYMNLGII